MINLIDEKDISYRKSSDDKIIGTTLDMWFTQLLNKKLELGLKTKELIYTQDLRGIGKTHSLIKFAKKYGLCVVVPTKSRALELSTKYIYGLIYGQDDINLRDKKVIVDEGVDVNKLETEMGCTVVTGFTNKKESSVKHKENNLSFSQEVVKTLKEEVKMLDESMKNALNKGDASMYKNLVAAYRDVVRLVLDMDWKLMHSEYNTEEGKQVAIWEQNDEGQIRNHKVWDVYDRLNKSTLTLD